MFKKHVCLFSFWDRGQGFGWMLKLRSFESRGCLGECAGVCVASGRDLTLFLGFSVSMDNPKGLNLGFGASCTQGGSLFAFCPSLEAKGQAGFIVDTQVQCMCLCVNLLGLADLFHVSPALDASATLNKQPSPKTLNMLLHLPGTLYCSLPRSLILIVLDSSSRKPS